MSHSPRGTKKLFNYGHQNSSHPLRCHRAAQGLYPEETREADRFADDIQAAEVVLKVVKPEVSNNKEASIKLKVNGADFFVDKTGNSFEESVDLCIDVLKRKLEKHKEA